jgi:hypothetical protein
MKELKLDDNVPENDARWKVLSEAMPKVNTTWTERTASSNRDHIVSMVSCIRSVSSSYSQQFPNDTDAMTTCPAGKDEQGQMIDISAIDFKETFRKYCMCLYTYLSDKQKNEEDNKKFKIVKSWWGNDKAAVEVVRLFIFELDNSKVSAEDKAKHERGKFASEQEAKRKEAEERQKRKREDEEEERRNRQKVASAIETSSEEMKKLTGGFSALIDVFKSPEMMGGAGAAGAVGAAAVGARVEKIEHEVEDLKDYVQKMDGKIDQVLSLLLNKK